MKRFASIFAAFVLSLSLLTLPVCAETPKIVDNAGLLTSYEVSELESILDKISDKHFLDVAVLTENGTGFGLSTVEYSEYFFEQNYGVGPDLDGVILFVNMSDREWNIATSGKAITSITDYGLEHIEDEMIGDLSGGYYFDAFSKFAYACDELLTTAENGEPFDYDLGNDYNSYYDNGYYEHYNRYDSFGLTMGNILLVSLVFGFIVALISVSVMKGKLKSVNSQREAGTYIRKNSFKLTQSKDIFLYRNVRRTVRVDESSSSSRSGGHSGGSAVHRSSSGHTFGGRSGRF